MNPFMRGFGKGWMVVFGGMSKDFGEMVGFVLAVLLILAGIAICIRILCAFYETLINIIKEIKKWWSSR
jgi:hypothetical protein